MRHQLISFDLKGDFGVFKKPDVNDGLQLTFNMLHKPALLGILGAIAGLSGYQQKGELPAYYRELRDIKLGIEPLSPHEKGNFVKLVVKYTNTVGYANADGTLIVVEQTLRSPAYRVYLLLDLDNAVQELLYYRIKAGEAEYIPYFGKNECYVWWDHQDVEEYELLQPKSTEAYSVASIFQKSDWSLTDKKEDDEYDFFESEISPDKFAYFERIPVILDERLLQYRLGNFTFTNFKLKASAHLDNLYYIKNKQQYVQLF